MQEDNVVEQEYLKSTLDLVNEKLNKLKISSSHLEGIFDQSNNEYFEYLKSNANKLNEEDVVELVNLQGRLDDLQEDSVDYERMNIVYNKMLDKPYFSSIRIKEDVEPSEEKYYIGIHSLVDDNKNFRIVDWRSPIASIFYDYEGGDCQIRTNSSILRCNLLGKRQYGITNGHLDYFFDTTINIEDDILKVALAQNSTNKMKAIVQTIQKEQNQIIRGDENKNLLVQGVAGSGKTAIALHRIAYLLYKMKDKLTSKNIMFLSPNNAFSSYISSVLPDLAEEDVEKIQLDLVARNYLKKHCILERRYQQLERIIKTDDLSDYLYKSSSEFLEDLLEFANKHYIENFHIDSLTIKDIEIDVNKINKLFFGRYSDRDLFTRLKWITDNIYDQYFYKYKKPETVVKIKELIFIKLYSFIDNKNCVKAYLQFLKEKGMKLELVGDMVKNEDAYGILFFKLFIFGLDKYSNIKHLMIDEMQDYTPLQMYILRNLFDCPMTILGDYNQSLTPALAKANFEYIPKILNGDSVTLKLGKSYRSTIEIADFFNKIGGSDKAEVVSRNGDKVDLEVVGKDKAVDKLLQMVKLYQDKGYKSIGIVTKNNAIARDLYNKIVKLNDKINLIDDNIDAYDNQVCIISAFNSKGLEFDGVIIIDSYKYFSTDIDRHIMYVASTRALHKLSVLSIEQASKFIESIKE